MGTLLFESAKRQVQTVRSRLSEILMNGNVPIDEDTARENRRVVCKQCSWKYELGEDVHPSLGTARARAHAKESGHTDIRRRFDLLDVDEGPVDLRDARAEIAAEVDR